MKEALSVTVEAAPEAADVQFLNQRLLEYNLQYTEEGGYCPLVVLLRDADRHIVGGLMGVTFWGWLHIDVLWVREDLRGAGHGGELLRLAEEEAARRGCHDVCVETHTFQALPFYEQRGYAVYGQLRGFPRPYVKYFLYKPLNG